MMRSRVALAAGIVAFAVAAIAGIVLLAADDGGDKPAGRAGSLIWADPPKLVYPQSLPTDRILYGQVRNDGLRDIKLSSADLRVLDRGGRALRSDGRFLQAYVHGMYGAYSRDKDIGEYERRRLGIVLTLKPGRTAPLTVAWHGRGARAVQIGDVKLPVPVAP
jgi:hypothetical protein